MGDSITYWMGNYTRPNPQLVGGGVVTWYGVRGAKIQGLFHRIQKYIGRNRFPTTIVIALGTNNIFKDPLTKIIDMLKTELKSIRELLPHTRLIWSDVLPRRKYDGEHRKNAGKRCTIDINTNARRFLSKKHSAHAIWQSHIFNPKREELFFDNVHLSEAGQQAFIEHLERALVYFNSFPSRFEFPPKPA